MSNVQCPTRNVQCPSGCCSWVYGIEINGLYPISGAGITWTLDIGHWILDIGHWILDIGHWTFYISPILRLRRYRSDNAAWEE